MLTSSEIEDLIIKLLDCRKNLLWMISQNPINDEQKKHIKGGKELLIKVNQALENLDVDLPA